MKEKLKSKMNLIGYFFASVITFLASSFHLFMPAWAQQTPKTQRDAIEALDIKLDILVKALQREKKILDQEIQLIESNDSVIDNFLSQPQFRPEKDPWQPQMRPERDPWLIK